MAASNQIVQVQVSQIAAPIPETLQQTGALISVGGTILSSGASALLTQLSDLTTILRGAAPLTSITWATGTATATATSPHGIPSGEIVELTIAGATPAGYNGTYACTSTGASTFTYAITDPGATPASVPGGYTPEDVSELVAMATDFFSQGNNVAVYVLELGLQDVDDAIQALDAYIDANPNSNYNPGEAGFYYAYLLPREWDANSHLLSLIAKHEDLQDATYFIVTTTLSTYKTYTSLMKDVVAVIETPAMGVHPQSTMSSLSQTGGAASGTTATAHGILPGEWFNLQGFTPAGWNGWWQAGAGTTGTTLNFTVPTTLGAVTVEGTVAANYASSDGIGEFEFQAAGFLYDILRLKPSPTNKATPFSFDFQFGVTPWPRQGLNALQLTLKEAAVNIIKTGAEGGISTAAWYWGTTMDGRGFLYWYSVDWVAINGRVNVANEVINGSNNPVNPLYYDQPGINRLQDRLAQTVQSAVTNGLANGQVVKTSMTGTDLSAAIAAGQFAGQIVVNAVPFLPYLTANPSDYRTGTYDGLSVLYIAQQGFISIQINIEVTDFIVQ